MPDSAVAHVWIICRYCGDKHVLHAGLVTPVYYCNGMKDLVPGDDIDYEEIVGETLCIS